MPGLYCVTCHPCQCNGWCYLGITLALWNPNIAEEFISFAIILRMDQFLDWKSATFSGNSFLNTMNIFVAPCF